MVTKEGALEFKVDKMELEEIWPLADYITVHTPYMPQTHRKSIWIIMIAAKNLDHSAIHLISDLINSETLKKCKRNVRIINIARGGIVDEAALLEALEAGECRGAALDVFAEEPPKEGSVSRKLIQHPNVVCTPHLGASTTEAQERVACEIAQQLIDLIQVN